MLNIIEETLSSYRLYSCEKTKKKKGEKNRLLVTKVTNEMKQPGIVEHDN